MLHIILTIALGQTSTPETPLLTIREAGIYRAVVRGPDRLRSDFLLYGYDAHPSPFGKIDERRLFDWSRVEEPPRGLRSEFASDWKSLLVKMRAKHDAERRIGEAERDRERKEDARYFEDQSK